MSGINLLASGWDRRACFIKEKYFYGKVKQLHFTTKNYKLGHAHFCCYPHTISLLLYRVVMAVINQIPRFKNFSIRTKFITDRSKRRPLKTDPCSYVHSRSVMNVICFGRKPIKTQVSNVNGGLTE